MQTPDFEKKIQIPGVPPLRCAYLQFQNISKRLKTLTGNCMSYILLRDIVNYGPLF